MFRFSDQDEKLTIESKPGETRAEFLKRIYTWLVVREQQRRKERKAERQEG